MITGCVFIKLDVDPTEDFSLDRRKLAALDRCPDGAEVLVDIGRRQFVTQDAASWLHRHDHRLSITIVGECPDAVGHFIAAARAGLWSVVS
jgi:hypothetical protein